MIDRPVRLCASPPLPPCTCGHTGVCTMCCIEEFDLETALVRIALVRTERACGLEGAKQ